MEGFQGFFSHMTFRLAMIKPSKLHFLSQKFKKIAMGATVWWTSRSSESPCPPRTRRLGVEELENRLQPAASISGMVFETVDMVDPSKKTPDQGLAGVRVILNGNTNAPQITDSQGKFTFTDVPSEETHTITVLPPSQYWGFSAQSLSFTVHLGSQPFSNLNFALTKKTHALVQNLFQQVLVRSGEATGFQNLTNALNSGATSGGQVLANFLNSSEFRTVVQPVATVLAGFFPNEPIQNQLLRNNIQLAHSGITTDASVLNVLYSQPFLAKYGDTSTLTNDQFVRFLYNKLLQRGPTTTEVNFWVNQMTRTTNPLNRGQVVLGFTASPEFVRKNPTASLGVSTSLAYLSLLGRSADPAGYQGWVNYLRSGNSIASMGNRMLASQEFGRLKGYDDLFLADIKSFPLASPVNPLNRLQLYNPSTFAFDKAVTPGSLSGLAFGSTPANVYFIAHGWAPGFAQSVLVQSTPGKPLTWWETPKYPSSLVPPTAASPWMFEGADKVSVEGLAQSIVDADPQAQIILYSWIDNSGTPASGEISLANAANIEGDIPYLSQSEAYTQLNGLRMAEAIKSALGAEFFQNKGLLHLLGHSHGTRVATVATLALQSGSVPVTQLTTMESPEAGPLNANITGLANGRNFLWYYLQQLNLTKSPLVGNTRTPAAGTFVDNYWSVFGVGMPFSGYSGLGSIVDVALNSSPVYGFNPVSAHSYPPSWYAQTALTNPESTIATTMTGTGITSVDAGVQLTVASNAGFPGTGANGFFIQIDNEIMQVTQGAGTNTWTIGTRGINGTTPALHTNLSSSVTLLQNNGLQWSPLINPTLAQNLVSGYSQGWSKFQFNQQFLLTPSPGDPIPSPPPVDVSYATQYKVGSVVDTGSGMTLSVDAQNPLAMASFTFTPISMSVGDQKGKPGSGLSLEFQFENAGDGDQLVIWERGRYGLSVPNPPGMSPIDTGSLGYRTVPLFVMTGESAGTTKHKAVLNLDAFFNNAKSEPLAMGMFQNNLLPTFGFSLIHSGTGTASVTISNLQQINDGSSS